MSSRSAVLVLLVASGACASAPGPALRVATAAPAPTAASPSPPPLPDVTFRAGEPPRRAVSRVAVVAPPAALAGSLDALSRRFALPVPLGGELLRALRGLPGMPLTRAQLDRLDPVRPITLVHLSRGIGVDEGNCAALAFTDGAAARQTLDELSVETARQGGESTRRLGSGRPFVAGVHGRTLLLSDKPRMIAVAGPLAVELQERPAASAFSLTVYPRALVPLDANALGSLFETAVVTTFATRKQKAEGATPATPHVTEAFVRSLAKLARLAAGPIAESRAATFALDLDERAGLALRIVLEPLPGTALARSLERPVPYAFDPGAALGPSAGIFAWGGVGEALSSFGELVAASGPAGRELRAAADAFAARVTGSASCSLDLSVMPIRSRCAWPLRPGAKPADVLRRYGAVAKDTVAWSNELLDGHTAAPRLRTRGGVLEVDSNVDLPGSTPAVQATMDTVLGGRVQKVAVTVKGGMLLTAQGGDPRALLAAPPPGASGAPVGVAAAIDRTKGANLLLFIDVATYLMRVLEVTNEPTMRSVSRMLHAIPGLESLRLPFVVTSRSGGTGTYELALPIETLDGVARVIGPYMGVMGGQPRP